MYIGQIDTFSNSRQKISIENLGVSSWIIDSFEKSDNISKVFLPLPVEIPPGGTLDIEFELVPIDPGFHSDYLIFYGRLPDGTEYSRGFNIEFYSSIKWSNIQKVLLNIEPLYIKNLLFLRVEHPAAPPDYRIFLSRLGDYKVRILGGVIDLTGSVKSHIFQLDPPFIYTEGPIEVLLLSDANLSISSMEIMTL